MKTEAVAAKRSKVHTRYKLKNGLLVPGVTTVTGVLDKPALIIWANRLGLQGIDWLCFQHHRKHAHGQVTSF